MKVPIANCISEVAQVGNLPYRRLAIGTSGIGFWLMAFGASLVLGHWCSVLPCALDFGTWNLFGAWKLELGTFTAC
jgi:hypothetical protein